MSLPVWYQALLEQYMPHWGKHDNSSVGNSIRSRRRWAGTLEGFNQQGEAFHAFSLALPDGDSGQLRIRKWPKKSSRRPSRLP